MKRLLILAMMLVPAVSFATDAPWTCVTGGTSHANVNTAVPPMICTADISVGTTTEQLNIAKCSPATSYVAKPNDTATSLTVNTSEDGGTTWVELDDAAIASGTNTEKNYSQVRWGQFLQVVASGSATGDIGFKCGGY